MVAVGLLSDILKLCTDRHKQDCLGCAKLNNQGGRSVTTMTCVVLLLPHQPVGVVVEVLGGYGCPHPKGSPS